MAVHRAPQASGRLQRGLLIFIPPALILIFVLALVFFGDSEEVGLERDADLCPLADADISARAVFIVDLVKPLDEGRRGLPGELLRNLSLGLGANTELRVFTLAHDAAAPRRQVERLCKPYDNADLAFSGAKDQSDEVRDCDDLPAQLPQYLRDEASQFCARRNALGQRLGQLAAQQGAAPVGSAYLIEALEETSLEFAELTAPRSLFVFSDMMQHANWYSHRELGWNGWSFRRFLDWRQAQDALVGPRPAPIDETEVTIFYRPLEELTAQLRIKAAHKGFWRDYFADAVGAEPSFQDQPMMAAYPITPLMNQMPEAQVAEQERLRLRREREEAEQALAQVEQEQAALAEARQQAAEEEREQEARMVELRRQRESLLSEQERQTAEAEAAERQRAEQERLRQERQEAERLAQLERERAAQEEARRQAEAEAREREAQEAEQRRQQELLAAQEAERQAAAEAERQAAAEAERLAAAEAERQAAAEAERQAAAEAERLAAAEAERLAAAEAERQAAAEAERLAAAEAERLAAAEAERLAAAEAERQAAAEAERQAAAEAERLAAAEAERLAAAEAAATEQPPAPPTDQVADAADLPDCKVRLKPQFLNAGNIYPDSYRVNYGNAVMIVAYVLDEQGRTVDDQVQIDREGSQVNVARHFDKFAEAAQNLVRGWEFSFEEADACNKDIELRSRFNFEYR